MSERKVIDFQKQAAADPSPEAEDEIVLSTSESPVPQGVTGDWAAEAVAEPDRADAAPGEGARGLRRVRQWIGALPQWPEQRLWHRYAASGMHQHLRESRQWYWHLEDRWRAELAPQDSENPETRRPHRLHRFVVNNPVTTVLLCLLAVYAGRAGTNYLLETPVPREDVAVAAITAPSPATIVPKIDPLPTADLEHCSLSPTLRNMIAPVDGTTKRAVLTEINSFHSSFTASGIAKQWQQFMLRRRLTEDMGRQLLPLAVAYHSRLERNRAQQLLQREELIRALDPKQASGLYDVDHVNRRIRQRGALERTERELAAGPKPAQLAVLGNAIQALRRRMGDVDTGSATDEPVPSQSEVFWAAAAQEMPPQQMKQELEQLLQRHVREPIAAGMAQTAAVNRYRLDRVTTALSSVIQLIDLQNEAASTLPNLDAEQAAVNHRLSELFGTPAAGGLVNYRACLTGQPAELVSSTR